MEQEEESLADCMDVLTALNGFGIVMNQEQDIVYVTNNVSEYIGLTAVSLNLFIQYFYYIWHKSWILRDKTVHCSGL